MSDNLLLRIEGDGVTHGTIDEVVDRMAGEEFWKDEGVWRSIFARLPEYRLSKFQPALPDHASTEMIGAYLLDAKGARAYLTES
jgi:ATP-dependent Lhr-like helicase